MSLVNSNAKVKVEIAKRISSYKGDAPIWKSNNLLGVLYSDWEVEEAGATSSNYLGWISINNTGNIVHCRQSFIVKKSEEHTFSILVNFPGDSFFKQISIGVDGDLTKYRALDDYYEALGPMTFTPLQGEEIIVRIKFYIPGPATSIQGHFKDAFIKPTSEDGQIEWIDVSEYYVETVTDYNFSIDDNNLTGKYSQESINIKFSNRSGAFNKPAIEGSLWRKGQYMYHSRIRVYEWDSEDEEPTTADIVIDGLIANYSPNYYLNGDCNLMINSKLDMLRDHFLVTEQNVKSTNASSQGVLNYIIRLYDLYYSELEINFDGCIFYNNIEFDNLAAYSDNLLDLFYQAIDSSGGYGGMINNTFFSSFVGAPQVEGANFIETNFPISIYHFDDTDKTAGTTISDQVGSNDLTCSEDWKEGLFTNAARNFVLYGATDIFPEIVTEYSVEMVMEFEYNKLFPVNLPLVFGASSTETGLYPLFAFSSDGTTNEIVIADFAANYYIEGFFIDKQYKVYYGRGQISGNSFAFSGYTELGQLDTNNMYQYIAFSQNNNGDISFFKNGRFVSGFRDVNDAGVVQSGTVALTAANRKRICGYGYFNRKNTATIKYEDTCALYYSGLKINYRELTEENCFNTYINLFSRRVS